mmetsp:Transcript_6529/g.15301  ORF Transcript_6529/g.15301 Transcript_6529/m.15301 type:complete len:268 (+) Transcript_6529:73-876(+)
MNTHVNQHHQRQQSGPASAVPLLKEEVKAAAGHLPRPAHEICAGLHVRVGQVGAERARGDQRVRGAHEFFVVVGRQLLPTLQDGQARYGAGALLDSKEVVAVLSLQPAVTVPACEEMVRHQQRVGEQAEGRSDHGEMRGRPHHLADRLRVAGDPDDACLPQVYPRRLDRRHLLQVEDGGVKEEEGGEVDGPGEAVRGGIRLEVPKLDAVVHVPNVVDDPRVGERQREGGEDDPPQPLPRVLPRPRPQRGETGVDEREEYAEGERDEM